MKRILLSVITLAAAVVPAFCCTSVIISGKITYDGKPVMMKHRDTGQLNNRLERFKGEKFDFVALVNSDWRTAPLSKYGHSGEAWTGVNSAGFSIMNTAAYNFKDDDVPASEMDREGIVMFRALSICETLKDFEHMLDTLTRPMGVEANFGVIDAHGGAAYYEVNNSRWVKFDVNEDPSGYMVVTNFTRTGRVEDRKGVDRYEKAELLMKHIGTYVNTSRIGAKSMKRRITHKDLINRISRSGSPILRDITSTSIVIEGVKDGDDPIRTVMWTALGCPATTVYVPVLVLDEDYIPWYLKSSGSSQNAVMCDNALKLKGTDVVEKCKEIEKVIDRRFESIYFRWTKGYLPYKRFCQLYDSICRKYYEVYSEKMGNS